MVCWVLRGRVLTPQILDMARQRNKRVKVVGGGHSPSDIACTDDFMIQMGKMNKVLKVRRVLKATPDYHLYRLFETLLTNMR